LLLEIGKDQDFNLKDVDQFCADLQKSRRNLSIDSFIESQQDRDDVIDKYVRIAKNVIAILIIKAERPEKVKLDSGWYSKLFEMMYKDRKTFAEFFKNKISFVTFNYDRSLEYYFLKAIQDEFGRSKEESEDMLIKHFPIVHVHGSIGPYWSMGTSPSVDYDGNWENIEKVKECGENIKLMTDKISVDVGRQKAREFIVAQSLINNARTIHFLGFGYNRNNLDRLGFGTSVINHQGKFFGGTVKNLSNQALVEISALYAINNTISRVGSGIIGASASVSNTMNILEYLDVGPFL
jgi:hypothetical protein